MASWTELIQSFTIGAFPWMSQLKSLKIHYVRDDLSIASIDNFFASLFSFSIYAYFSYASEIQLIYLPEWYYFILLALILSILYLTIFIYCKEKVKSKDSRWPIILNFIIYISIFVSLTFGFGLLKVYDGYYVLKGKVTDMNAQPIEGTDVEISNDQTTYKETTITNRNGEFYLLIDKKEIDGINSLIFTKEDYAVLKPAYYGKSSLISYLNHNVVLIKEKQE